MEFVTAPLHTPATGPCNSCGNQDTALHTAVVQIAATPKAYANGQRRTEGLKAFLICQTCSTTHPLWKILSSIKQPADTEAAK